MKFAIKEKPGQKREDKGGGIGECILTLVLGAKVVQQPQSDGLNDECGMRVVLAGTQ